MRSVSELSVADVAQVSCVLTDIDDTLTTDGRLGSGAYRALEDLQAAGFAVVPVTGRPAGWCDLIARLWPVDGVVGENGAFYLRYDRATRQMHSRFWIADAERHANRACLDALADTILASVPGTALASDQPYRVSDLAIDFCEDVPPLGQQQVDQILRLFEQAGATAKASSIHVNGWFGHFDKLSMARELLTRELCLAPGEIESRVVFVGDSPNDEPLFAAFPLSVGVANVMRRRRSHPAHAVLSRLRGGRGRVRRSRRAIDRRPIRRR